MVGLYIPAPELEQIKVAGLPVFGCWFFLVLGLGSGNKERGVAFRGKEVKGGRHGGLSYFKVCD